MKFLCKCRGISFGLKFPSVIGGGMKFGNKIKNLFILEGTLKHTHFICLSGSNSSREPLFILDF